jgi:hypothetical protein
LFYDDNSPNRCSPAKIPENIQIDFTDDQISSFSGSVFISRLARHFGLERLLSESVRLKVRNRGASDVEFLQSLIFCLAAGQGHLCDVDRLGADDVRQMLLGLDAVPDSRRVSDYLARFDLESVTALREVAHTVAQKVVGKVAAHANDTLGYVPIFADGTAIEVTGEHFQGARKGYNAEPQYWLHSVFVDRLWASQYLHEGGVGVARGVVDQLEETDALLDAKSKKWLRADSAYYQKNVVNFCEDRGWDFSISVTNNVHKGPLKRAMQDLRSYHWESINDFEQAAWIVHKPSGWKNWQTYVVVKTYEDVGQQYLFPRHSFILCSNHNLPLKEAVKRHRGKQGQENAQKSPLIDLDLHHPPCRKMNANRAYYTLGQIAQILLIGAQYFLLPKAARKHGLATLIRDLIRTAGKLVFHARRATLLFAKTAFRLDWISQAADRLEELPRPAT